MEYDYDLVIIGAGPGGYVAGIRASQLGLKTVVIEKDKVGGVCLNVGCIPSKVLIHQANLYLSIAELQSMDIDVDVSRFSYKKVVAKSRNAADTLSKGVNFLLKKNKVDLIHAEARIKDPHCVVLNDGREVSGRNILIATGARPREIPGFSFDEDKVLSSTGALMMESLPEKICILGGGAIGVEFAHIMNAFGVEVHLVEMMDQLLPLEDAEVVQVLLKSFKKRGIKVYTGTKAHGMNKAAGHISVSLEGVKEELKVDRVLVVVGRALNTEGLGLEELGVKTDRGIISIGNYCQTSVPGIFAIGDVTSSPMLAHVASREGEIAVEYMAGLKPEPVIESMAVPSAVYCEPQVASFGYTEEKAKEEGLSFGKAVFPYRGAGKSVAIGKPEGLVKILFNAETHEIIGARIVGADATELIHELLLAKTAELLTEDIVQMIHAHPTLSETVMEAARSVENRAIHI